MSATDNTADALWVKTAQQFVAALAATGKQFSIDEVWDMLDHRGGGVTHSAPKAMGAVMQHMSKRTGIIGPLPVWQTSCRNVDRPSRVFMGTEHVDPNFEVSEDQIVWALEAVERVARVRSQQMLEHVRGLRADT